MSKVDKIITLVGQESPGLLDAISSEDGISKEELVRKVLALSRGQMVRTHQNEATEGKDKAGLLSGSSRCFANSEFTRGFEDGQGNVSE